MSRSFLLVVGCGFVMLFGDLVVAQQPVPEPVLPDLQLIRGLRNQGTPDLALEYIQRLQARPGLSPDLAATVALEMARTKLVLAEAESNEIKRNALVAQARAGFETFVKQFPAHPEVLSATLDLSRLLVQEGQAHFHQARHYNITDAAQFEARTRELNAGRHEMYQAARLYENVSAILEEQRRSAPEPQKEKLSLKIRQGDIEWGIIYFDIADSIPSGGGADSSAESRLRHGKVLDQARKIFQGAMDEKKKDSIHWMGLVWAAQCAYKSTPSDNKGFEAFPKLVASASGTARDAGYRLYSYFKIEQGFENRSVGTGGDPLTKLEIDSDKWLHDYPAYHRTREGLACTFFAANAKYEIAQKQLAGKKGPMPEQLKQKLNDAARLFEDLTETLNEYKEGAQRNRDHILFMLTESAGTGKDLSPESLADLERNYLAAQLQVIKFNKFTQQTPKPDAKAMQAEKTLRFTNAIRYLDYSLAHLTPADSVRDVFNARALLGYCYSQLEMNLQDAVLSEWMARNYPKMPKASAAAYTAMEMYQRVLVQDREKDPPEDPLVVATDLARVRNMAKYIVDTFPDEPYADNARFTLAFYLRREKKLQEACNCYLTIQPTFPGIAQARFELGSCLYSIIFPSEGSLKPAAFAKAVSENIAKNHALWDATVKSLETIPAPSPKTSEAGVRAYFRARVELTRLYQLAGFYAKIKPVGMQLKEALKSVILKEDVLREQSAAAEGVILTGLRTEAVDLYKKNQFEQVEELLKPVIAEFTPKLIGAAPVNPSTAEMTLLDQQRQLVNLALTNSIKAQRIDRAEALLDILEKAGGTIEKSTGQMKVLMEKFIEQAEDLRKMGPAKDGEFKKLSEGVGKFLEKIIKKGDELKDPNDRDRYRIDVAKTYTAIAQFDKATEMLNQIRKHPAPAPPIKPIQPLPLRDNATPEEEKSHAAADEAFAEAVAIYDRAESVRAEYLKLMHTVDYLLAKNFRAAKDYPKALEKFEEIVGNTKKPDPKVKKWGFGSLEIRKEVATLREDIAVDGKTMDKWAEAVQEWARIQQQFIRLLPPVDVLPKEDSEEMLDPKKHGERLKKHDEIQAKRNLYFELFYEIRRTQVRAFSQDPAKFETNLRKIASDFDLLKKGNKDIPEETWSKIMNLYEQYPALKAVSK